MLLKAYLGKKPKTVCQPSLCPGVLSFLGEEEQPCMEDVSAPQVYTAAKWCFCLYFLITHSFFLLSLLLGSSCRCYIHLAILTWRFCSWMTVVSSEPIVSHVKLSLINFCHHVSLYSHLHKCHLLFHYPLSLTTSCCFFSTKFHQSALVANALINLILSFFV